MDRGSQARRNQAAAFDPSHQLDRPRQITQLEVRKLLIQPPGTAFPLSAKSIQSKRNHADVIEGHPMLCEAALYASRQWKFAPSTVAARIATLKFSFVVLPDTAQLNSQV